MSINKKLFCKNKLEISGIAIRNYSIIKHPAFALPGRKALLKSDIEHEVIVIDASESPIERPKRVRNKNE